MDFYAALQGKILNTTFELVDANGNPVPIGPPPSANEQFFHTLGHATPWKIFASLPAGIQLTVVAMLTLTILFGILAAYSAMTRKRVILAGVRHFAGTTAIPVSVVCVVWIMYAAAAGLDAARVAPNVAIVTWQLICCLYLLTVGLLLWRAARLGH